MRFAVEVLPIEGDPAGAEIMMSFDEEGLEFFQAHLSHLKGQDHTHFMSNSWGGKDLDEESTYPSGLVVRHLKVFLDPAADAGTEPTQ